MTENQESKTRKHSSKSVSAIEALDHLGTAMPDSVKILNYKITSDPREIWIQVDIILPKTEETEDQ